MKETLMENQPLEFESGADEFRPSQEILEYLTRSPLFMAIVSTLTVVEQRENTLRVIPLIESRSGRGKTSFAKSLTKVIKPTDGRAFELFVSNAPDMAKPVQDIAEEDGMAYAYTVVSEAEMRAHRCLQRGNYPIILIEEMRAAPIQHIARLLYHLMGNPANAEMRYIGVTNPPGSYFTPDALNQENLRQRLGEPIDMDDVKQEPIVRHIKKIGRISGYEPLLRIEPKIVWDEAAEDFYLFIEQVMDRAMEQSTHDRGIPQELLSDRQTELFTAHLLAAQSLIRANGFASDILNWSGLYRAIATMRFGAAGAATIAEMTDQSLFPVVEFVTGDQETRDKILATPQSRIVAYSIRLLTRAWVRQLADQLKAGEPNAPRAIVEHARQILALQPYLEAHPSPVAPILKRGLTELFFGETGFTALLIRAGINPADVLKPYTTGLIQPGKGKKRS